MQTREEAWTLCTNLCVWRQSRASQARRRVGADGQQKGLELLVSRPAAGGRGLSQSGETETPVLLPGTPQSSLSAGALRYRAWAQSWSSAALAARSVLPSNRPATPHSSPACWSVCGISQARIPEWAVISHARGSS